MSKRGYISRYLIILRKLKVKPYSSYEELKTYMESQIEFLQMQDDTLSIGFSKRTLQRDLRDIRNVFGVDVEYSRARNGYFISHDEAENLNFQRMMESFDVFNSLKLAQDLKPYIHLENRRMMGTDNLYGLLHAIKHKYQIRIHYQKFGEEQPAQRLVEPFAIKEFRYRWYLIAKEIKDNNIKTFALDRLSNLEITNKKFNASQDYSIEENFRYSFGIISPNGQDPQDIVLSFDPFQGKYIKTLPLHNTQNVILDTDDELQIELKLCMTHDLIMELLSFGDSVKVLQPQSLADEIKAAHINASKLYQKY
jgi:proteasome accessory factor B